MIKKNLLKQKFEQNQNKEIAIKQKQYLLNQFEFYGIRKPDITSIFKEEIKQSKLLSKEELWDLVFEMKSHKEREWEILAQDFLKINYKRFNEQDIYRIIDSILINSWWDSVDAHASILTLVLLNLDDWDLIRSILFKLNISENIWLKRVSLIAQNKFKKKTDLEFQFNLIKNTWNIDVFWIQKAIGWSLREISKTYPNEISYWIKQNDKYLSNLAKKEGMKTILKNEKII